MKVIFRACVLFFISNNNNNVVDLCRQTGTIKSWVKPIPPRAQGLLTEVWQRRKRQTSRQGDKNLQFLSGFNF